MKIHELVEQTVSPIGPGGQTPIPTTGPTQGPTTNQPPSTANTATNATQMGQQPTNPQNMSNIKNNLNNLKSLLGAAGATGNIDTSKIAGALADPKQAMNPGVAQQLKNLLPGIADALQSNQAASQIKAGINTGVTAQQKIQQAANDDQYKQVAESIRRLAEALEKLP